MTKLSIQLRTPNDDGTADYRTVFGFGTIRTPVAPSVGDRLEVPTEDDSGLISVKVIERRWMYPQHGSGYWPYDSPQDFVPEALLLVIVQEVPALYADERRIG